MNSISGFYFDTYNTITASCSEEILSRCMEECSRYEHLLSKTLSSSDVWLLNHAEGQPVTVNKETAQLLECSLKLYRASNGSFNIAVGPLMELWDFRAKHPRIPTEHQITLTKSLCTPEQIEVDGLSVRIPAYMRIDLGGIAKGYIADRIGDLLRDHGVVHGLLNFGGNIVVIGPKEDGSPWRIGLQSPGGTWGKDYWAVTELTRGTVVTSAVSERGFDLDGHRYHHVLDPRTGWPVENGLVSVTVVGNNSMLADGLSTALLVLGSEDGLALVQQYGFQGLTIHGDGTVLRTSEFVLLQ